jgi:soluble cytochrome b562
MSHVDDSLLNRPRQRADTGKQPLVVRQTENDSQVEILEKLAKVEAVLNSTTDEVKAKDYGKSFTMFVKSVVAVCAIVISVAGYVIQDARNSSRQDAEIEATKVRVTNLEKIATANTEGRIRTEVELQGLREGQAEIKRMIAQHEDETRKILRAK